MNVVQTFQEMKRIHGVCPCCSYVFRLSEAELFTRERPPKTEFDKVRDARERLEQHEEEFKQQLALLRQAATKKGWREARRRLRRIAPAFVGRGIDPQDVKVVFHPVEYVAFRGLTHGEPKAIEFIDREADSAERERLQASIERAIRAGNLEWHTYRVDTDGSVRPE